MPDIPNRDAIEKILARMLGSLTRREKADLMIQMGNPPKLENVPTSFWKEYGDEWVGVLNPISERVYLESAVRLGASIPVRINWSLVNESASRWAQQYSFELVGGIQDTTQTTIANAISSFYEDGLTMGELEDLLGSAYSPNRATMIARTEVTRAAAEGEREIVEGIRKQGIQMVEVWQTRNDSIVCTICGPRHGTREGTVWDKGDPPEPPAHPNCRCWINHGFGNKEQEQRLEAEAEGVDYMEDISRVDVGLDKFEYEETWEEVEPEDEEPVNV